MAKLGRDVFGDQAIEGFRREGIITDCILRDPTEATGVALIVVDERGENMISVASGANHRLSPQDVDAVADRISAADALMLQLEIPMEAVCRAARLAADAGVIVILDPAPAVPLPDGLLEHVTYLTPNENEAERLTGISVSDEASARRAAEKLLSAGAWNAIITLGAKGALAASRDGATLVLSRKVPTVDTTAAGDAFNGGLAWALARGYLRRKRSAKPVWSVRFRRHG